MKRKSLFAIVASAVFFLPASAAVSAQGKEGMMNITVTIGGTEYAAQFDDNAAAREVASLFPI